LYIIALSPHENKVGYILNLTFDDKTVKGISIWLGKIGEQSELMEITEEGTTNYILPSNSTGIFQKLI
jgi:hypothetical protein